MENTGKRLKVAQVITRLDWGGSPDIVRVLCRGLDSARYDVTLVSGPTKHVTAKTKEFLAAFKGRVIEIPSLQREIDLPRDAAAFAELRGLFRRERFDVIHTHTAKAGALGRVAARLAGCRAVVHTPHGHNLYGYFGAAMTAFIVMAERFAALFCDRMIALTDLEKKDMVRYGLGSEGKIAVIRQGLELDRYVRAAADPRQLRKRLGIHDGEVAVGMVGRLEAVKGPAYFVEAAATVVKRCPKAKFIIAGDGSMLDALEARVEALGLTDMFVFTGWRDDVPDILAAFDIFVLPSLNEAVGMALVEAQASGVAAVATAVGGVPEVIVDGQTGILVKGANADSLAAAIIDLVSDEGKRRRLAAAGKARVMGAYRADEMVRHISQLYEELLGRGR